MNGKLSAQRGLAAQRGEVIQTDEHGEGEGAWPPRGWLVVVRPTIPFMDERGWGWTSSEIRQIRLVEWIVPRSADTYGPVKPFYDEQAGQDALTLPVVHGELHDLARRSLIDLAAGIGGVESYDALATPEARRRVEDLQARRADKGLRKAACRDAMADWLYSRDVVSPS